MSENLKESSMKESGYEYEYEAQEFLAEIEGLPMSLRPKGQLYHVERTIAEASGVLKAGKTLDFTYEEGEWRGTGKSALLPLMNRLSFP